MKKTTLRQKILIGFAGCVVVLAVVATVSFRNSEKFIDTNKWVNHTHEVINEFDLIMAYTVDLETGMRGYVITGNTAFLDPYREARANLDNHLVKVKKLTEDNPAQQANIDLLSKVIAESRGYMEEVIQLRQSDYALAQKSIADGKGKDLQDQVRRTIAVCKQMEQTLLNQRSASSEEDSKNFNSIFIFLLVIITVVLVAIYFIINSNLNALKKVELENADKNWLLAGGFELNEKTRGEREAGELAQTVIEQLCNYLKVQIGVLYLMENGQLSLAGSYAHNIRKGNATVIKIGEGLIGQAAAEKKTIVFTEVPADYVSINSGLGSIAPRNILVAPMVQDNVVKGVIEIGATREFTALDMQLLKMVTESLAIIFNAAQSRTRMKELLEETQRQAEELQAQQEELKQSNEELQEKTFLLEKSEGELKAQQEELQQTNEELEEKANLLETQKQKLENAKMDIETKARELEVTSKYKSEFLANMSHELRTPLNSILILSQLLAENKTKVLGEKEIEYSKNIYNSGTDLLHLINEILDLSKVEAGKMELDIAEVPLQAITRELDAVFVELAKSRSITFAAEVAPGITSITTDRQRLQQILKNLLSNAFKFTPAGGNVTLTVKSAGAETLFKNSRLDISSGVIGFEVSDTGIGIPKDKQTLIFEAFQQADGSTKRRYGGTGLGLSISRELAGALGGEIQLISEQGKGSTFTLYLPAAFDSSHLMTFEKKIEVKTATHTRKEKARPKPLPSDLHSDQADDDRYQISENDRVILIMEDDADFARILLDFVRERNYKGIVADRGNVGLSYARYHRPDAVILDMKLPVMDGSEVLRHLKNDPELRHIPVQIISGYDRKKESLELGAFNFLHKPIDRNDLQQAFDNIEEFINKKLKKLLVVEDNQTQSQAIRELIGNGDVKSQAAFSGKDAIEMLSGDEFDCIILDLGLPDMTGFDLLEKIKSDESLRSVPIVVYTGRDLSRDENTKLLKYANTVVLKTADSKERLLDETMLFLHRVESRLPTEKQKIIRKLHKMDEVLHNRKILVVDDDIRNIYSLTNALEEEGLKCITAENGKVALKVLKDTPDIELILMDVMMPEMDGYEATRAIRQLAQFEKIPIIALTAKAMKGDRDKCLQAGMSDYITKPVNIEQLFSLMRVWLYK